ncbi:hypothetical protein K437DRAFT_239901 [Tilletiaria anomala UBC 951]|uniref:RING-type domain-containing protein n=1 Tax=Tilletiaria anomala (strain ATCC 24038 / CBS 436.72 / UBC 951) TaxID=1037660 RepID=A0A066VB51_TILAU|nr:uncharacterized protein K437DRAFT_239901 [Tilletiaria anomala UBC 951]KDN38696.1 hypothetical protein K437DRAFT_239901 [Tilletiaria anomala UBC 951]
MSASASGSGNAPESTTAEKANDEEIPPEVELCFICAEPVHLYSLPPCDHITCHMCAVRLRALYKKIECTFCKAPAESLIFTSSTTKTFAEYTPEELPHKDAKLSISFLTREAMEETLFLLRFNCPDTKCEVASAGWNDLKSHIRRDHGKLLCDLCVRNKKIFAHEHTLYNKHSLGSHMSSDHRFCEYCHAYFYSDDELFVHMRDRHEQCHICKARGGEAAQTYFKDYTALERHFKLQHFLCPNAECLEKKFIVFPSEMDFKAHQLAEHGAELTSRERREAIRVDAAFTYDNPAEPSRGGERRAGRSRRDGKGMGADQDQEQEAPYLANRSSVPGASRARGRRAAFGGSLTTNIVAVAENNAVTTGQSEDERIQQHQIFLARVKDVFKGSEPKVSSFRAAVRGYLAGEMSAKDLTGTVHSLTGDLDAGSLIINGLVELLEDEEKRTDVLTAWNGLRIERTQFPSLVPNGIGAASSSGFRYSNAAQGHIQLRNIKSSASSSSRVWANVERAAALGAQAGRGAGAGTSAAGGRSSQFPALLRATGPNGKVVPGSGSHSAAALKASGSSAVRSTRGSTPWSTSSALHQAPSASSSTVTPRSQVMPSSYASKSTVGSCGNVNSSGVSMTKQHFPGLPAPSSSATALAEKKRQALAKSKGMNRTLSAPGGGSPGAGGSGSGYGSSNGGSGASTPTWGGSGSGTAGAGLGLASLVSRIDGSTFVVGAEEEGAILDAETGDAHDTGGAGGGGGGRKKKRGVALMTLGAVQRG